MKTATPSIELQRQFIEITADELTNSQVLLFMILGDSFDSILNVIITILQPIIT
jgi:hypothetical protein